ncbi:MAG: endonuclease/exonuclease/phosphatase family protein, partial [Balneolaceae bacterium]
AADPDLVALQEVDIHWGERSDWADQASELARALGMERVFGEIYRFPGATADDPDRRYGLAILSRWPIVEEVNHTLTRLATQGEDPTPTPMPGFPEAVIDWGGRTIRFFSTHLDYRPDPSVRRQQVVETLEILDRGSEPIILAGDLNARPESPELRPLFESLQDVWAEAAGPGTTFPADNPDRRIDYILYRGPWQVVHAEVPETTASDHRPVVADMVWRP